MDDDEPELDDEEDDVPEDGDDSFLAGLPDPLELLELPELPEPSEPPEPEEPEELFEDGGVEELDADRLSVR